MAKKIKSEIKSLVLIVLSVCLLSSVVLGAESKFYNLELNYADEVITFQNIDVMPGIISSVRMGNDYRVELIGFRQELLYDVKFEISSVVIVDEIDFETGELNSETIELNESGYNLLLPYFENGKTINIYNQNNEKVLVVDVGYFAQTCGDGTCQEHENYLECSQDCPSGSADDFCNKVSDGICDSNCGTEDVDCPIETTQTKENNTKIFFIFLIPILGLIFIFLVWMFKKKDFLKLKSALKTKN